jgi:hypothetical protein
VAVARLGWLWLAGKRRKKEKGKGRKIGKREKGKEIGNRKG